jgi:putative transposase
MARGKRFSPEQIIARLRQIEVQLAQEKSVALACKEAGISEQSYYRWRKEYGGLQLEQARLQTQLYPEDDEGCEGDGGEEVGRELVVARGDAAEVLKPTEGHQCLPCRLVHFRQRIDIGCVGSDRCVGKP